MEIVEVVEKDADNEPTLLERWLKDQQEWQKTAMAYLDSMVRDEEFLTHIGNAMRGSLLAGKPYPGVGGGMPGSAETAETTSERMDEILHALHQIQGQLTDLRLSVEELQRERSQPTAAAASKGDAAPTPSRTATRAAGRKKPVAKRAGRRKGGTV